MALILECRYCLSYITFDDHHISEKSGKKIPLDAETLEPHRCKKHKTFCKYCKAEIHFSDDEITDSGKHIPLGKSGGHHRCKARPYNRWTRQQWAREQQTAEEEREYNRRGKERAEQELHGRFEQYAKQLEYCNVLGVSAFGNPPIPLEKDVKAAYRRLCLVYHPDRNPPEKWEWAHAMFRKLTEAFERIVSRD